VRLEAPDALQLAGLRRLAASFGFEEISDPQAEADAALWAAQDGERSGLEVAVAECEVAMRFEQLPSEDTWRRVYELLLALSGLDADSFGAP
jgi:hypothetical protein